MSVLVMKFGGAAVATPEQFSKIAELILERGKEYSKLVIVISAMGKTTDQLIELAKQVHPSPPQREYDMLISTGERVSMALLAMALCLKGREALSFTGSQSGIITCQRHSQAHIIDVRPQRILSCLEEGKIAIIAGFQGVSLNKEITTLGRGGSDTTAVALGAALKAEKVEFFKDVPGVYDQDPKIYNEAVHQSILSYQSALEIVKKGAKILHSRAIELAEKNSLPLYVRSFLPNHHEHHGTIIFDERIKKNSHPIFESS